MGLKIDQNEAAEWINNQWKGPKHCPICKNNNWNIGDSPFELRHFERGELVVGGPVIPLLAITCGVCGHTLLFNALLAQLLDLEEEETFFAEESEGPESETKEEGE